jgi:transcriptional regulator with XRE-family HTH domain
MSQEKLAKKLNTKQSVISRIENGGSIPSLRFVRRVAEALDTEVDITFQPRNTQEMSSPSRPSNNSIEYICVDCLYRWESKIERPVMQCPQCHKRQGVIFSEYLKALQAFQDMKLQVKKSPPFKKLPPVKSIRNDSSKMLKLILETAGNTFPSPRLPISLLFRIIEQSRQERVDSSIEGKNNLQST